MVATFGSVAPLARSDTRLATLDRHATVLVSSHVYRLCWWLVLAVHIFVALFVLFVGLSHLALSIPIVHASTIALGISIPLKGLSGACYVLVALAHFRGAARLIAHSLQAQRLTLQRVETERPQRVVGRGGSALRHARQTWAIYFGTDGYIGINGPFFGSALVVRELVETVTQTYQAYTLSQFVATQWVNHFAVASVVLNCWSTLLVRIVGAHLSVPVRRGLHLVADMYLDFVFGVILPVCVMVPYVVSYDWANGTFPHSLLDDDVWLVNAVAEARQVLVTSYLDLFASLLPHAGIYNCLSVVKRLARTSDGPTYTEKIAMTPAPAVSDAAIRAAPNISRLTGSLIVGMSAWGCVVLGIHLDAQIPSQTTVEGCLRVVRPWLTTHVACSVLLLNCYRQQMVGSASELHEKLNGLHRQVLAHVTIAHCPALEIPHLISEFSGIYLMDVHNSTLVEWPMAAAITQATHPMAMAIKFRNSRLASFPAVLLRRDLPFALNNVGFFHCNLSELPEELGDVWASTAVDVFGLEGSSVRRLPTSLSRVHWRMLWLASNQLDELPDALLNSGAKLERLWLSGNPLTRLPATISSTAHLSELFVEDTEVAVVPAWVNAWLEAPKPPGVRARASFQDSPACRDGGSASRGSRLCPDNLLTRRGVLAYNVSATKYPL